MEQLAFSNAYVPHRFKNKLFVCTIDFGPLATLAGYVTHVDTYTRFVDVETTQIMSVPRKQGYPINCHGRVGLSFFNRDDIVWYDMPEVLEVFVWDNLERAGKGR